MLFISYIIMRKLFNNCRNIMVMMKSYYELINKVHNLFIVETNYVLFNM